MGQKLDFLDGVSHNFFIYRPIAPKLHKKVCIVCIDTSLSKDKKIIRPRSKVKVKWAKNSFFSDGVPHNFSFIDRLRPVFYPFDLDLWPWAGIFFISSHGCVAANILVEFGLVRAVNETVLRYTLWNNRVSNQFDLDLWPWSGILFFLSQAVVDAHFWYNFGAIVL